MSRTPVNCPSVTSFSIVRPPVPVAWNTMGSNRALSRSMICVTAGVVTPNMVRPMAGLPPVKAAGVALIAVIASAARLSTTRLIRLRPARSVMAGIMMMSDTSTNADVSPEASVETMSFGTPSGRARMPAVAIDVPPPPPMPMIPTMSALVTMNRANAAAIPATASPRSVPERRPGGPNAAMVSAAMSGTIFGGRVPTSTTSGEPPSCLIRSDTKASSSPFVSAVPTT